MGFLIDASTLIHAERGGLDLRIVIASAGVALDDELAIAAVTAAELLHGAHRITSKRRRVRGKPQQIESERARAHAAAERAVGSFTVLAFDLAVARVYARTWARLMEAGTMVGLHDVMVAATADAHGLGVVTNDPDDFHVIVSSDPDLEVEIRTPAEA